jgi:ribose/xylose/arabinose/galactoside ABC-type transport system permease subunit
MQPSPLSRLYHRHRHEFQLLAALAAVFVTAGLLDGDHNYFTNFGGSAGDIVRQTALLGVFALGAAIVIIAGGIDLSSGSVIAFSGTICASVLLLLAPDAMNADKAIPTHVLMLAIGATLLCGFLIGTLHAWLITRVGLPPFVATLATLVGLRSFARAIILNVTEYVHGKGVSRIEVYDNTFRDFGRTITTPTIIFLVLAGLCWLLLARTVTGRHLYALGGNEQAARLSGIQTERLKWFAYSLSAVLASIAGILGVGYDGEANPQSQGVGYELNAIAAAVVGGCSLAGGVGTIPGTVLGALFLRTVIDGIAKVIKTAASLYEGLVVGVVVVLAVAFSQIETGMKRTRFFSGWLGLVTVLNLSVIAAALAALIGPKLLEGKTSLDGKFLAGLTFVGLLLLLLLVRWEGPLRVKRIAGGVLAVGWIAATIFLNANLPIMRYRAALQAVERAGGSTEQVSDGLAVDFTGKDLDDEKLKRLLGHLKYLSNMTELRLKDTQVTNAGMIELAREIGGMEQSPLRRLDLRGTQVKRLGERRVEMTIPEVKIQR